MERTAAHDGPAPFAPTALDGLVDRLQTAAPTLVRATDLILVLVAGALTLTDVVVWATDPSVPTGRLSSSLGALVPVLGAVATVAVAARPRWPARALATVAALGIGLTLAVGVVGSSLPPSFAALFALAVLTAGVLRREVGSTAVVLAAGAGGAVAAEALRPFVAGAAYLLVVCEGAFALAVGIGVYLRWSDWRRTAATAAARTDERLEVARELHDLLGHHVTGMVVQAQAARHVSRNRAEAADAALASIEAAGTDALAALRGMVGVLRDEAPAVRVTWDDVDDLVAEARDRGDPVRSAIEPAVRRAAPALAPSVHRIVAESLTNVRRHARRVERIEVDVRRRAGHVVVVVSDDGVPAAAAGPDTYGIVGMRERAVALGGSLTAGPGADGGWVVRAELPVGDGP